MRAAGRAIDPQLRTSPGVPVQPSTAGHAAQSQPTPGRLAQAVAAAFLALASASSFAQSYRCNSGGQMYFPDRPCNLDTKIQMYGPLRPAPSVGPLPGPPKAEEHLQYLGAQTARPSARRSARPPHARESSKTERRTGKPMLLSVTQRQASSGKRESDKIVAARCATWST